MAVLKAVKNQYPLKNGTDFIDKSSSQKGSFRSTANYFKQPALVIGSPDAPAEKIFKPVDENYYRLSGQSFIQAKTQASKPYQNNCIQHCDVRIQRLTALNHTGPENFSRAHVRPYSQDIVSGNDYTVYTDRGNPVAAWVAYNGSPAQYNSWCHGFSFGTYDRWGYSIYSGTPVATVLRDEYALIPARQALPGDIIVWRRPVDFPHTAILTQLHLLRNGSVDYHRSTMNSKNGINPVELNIPIHSMISQYGRNIEFYRKI